MNTAVKYSLAGIGGAAIIVLGLFAAGKVRTPPPLNPACPAQNSYSYAVGLWDGKNAANLVLTPGGFRHNVSLVYYSGANLVLTEFDYDSNSGCVQNGAAIQFSLKNESDGSNYTLVLTPGTTPGDYPATFSFNGSSFTGDAYLIQ